MSQSSSVDGAGFSGLLAALRVFRAGTLAGDPSDRALARAAGVSPTTIGNWLAGTQFPQDEGKFLVVVRAVARRAAARGVVPSGGMAGLLDQECWCEVYRAEARRRAGVVSAGVQRAQAARALAPLVAGWPLEDVTNPFALEVHRPVQLDDPPPELPVLPIYLPREHDQVLAQVVRAAAEGRSGIAVLVGGSSTGKTRACWEALALLRGRPEPWRLWHPIDPTRPDAALRELPGIAPRTVVWLNEAQFYLDTADAGLGEKVAAGLRELLRDPSRAPVLVLVTMWPGFWDALTGRPDGGADPHAQARELMVGYDISVPAALTPAQVGQLARVGDVRLVLAARSAPDGEVIQFLAGAPELLARYRNAQPAARALIHAAMDARRLGMGAGLPHAFLEAAAPGYLTDAEWDALGEDWLEQALAYAAVTCKGARGPLTRIRSRPVRRAREHGDQPNESASAAVGPLYRLADYLDQHGRAHQASKIPPTEFWAAAAAHAAPGDQAALGNAAHARSLYRAAVQLHKNAAASGNPRAVLYLSQPPDCLRADTRPAHWAATHAPLDRPVTVARLLDSLREAGAEEQAAALLARDPAAHAPLNDPGGVAWLLDSLRGAGAEVQATALLARDPAAHAPLNDLAGVASLLDSLRKAGADKQATTLADRTVAHAPLDNPVGVARLLLSLLLARADKQTAALLARDPAANTPIETPYCVALLLDSLQGARAEEQAAALLARDPAAHAPLDDPFGVAWLLDSLRGAGADKQATMLADRAAAHVPLNDPIGVARLFDSLRGAGAAERATMLADRAASRAPLDDPGGVALLLDSLRGAGAAEQATMLADRAASRAPLDDPGGVALLLDSLRGAGAAEQATMLADRAASRAPLNDPGGVARLLDSLRKAGADKQAIALLGRDLAAETHLDNPVAVARLLDSLRKAGADKQATMLAGRLPSIDRFGREVDGIPAGPWDWDDLDL